MSFIGPVILLLLGADGCAPDAAPAEETTTAHPTTYLSSIEAGTITDGVYDPNTPCAEALRPDVGAGDPPSDWTNCCAPGFVAVGYVIAQAAVVCMEGK